MLSRVGEGSKIVLTGDIHQIDSTYLDAGSNGLSYTVERLKGQPLYGYHAHENNQEPAGFTRCGTPEELTCRSRLSGGEVFPLCASSW